MNLDDKSRAFFFAVSAQGDIHTAVAAHNDVSTNGNDDDNDDRTAKHRIAHRSELSSTNDLNRRVFVCF